VGRTSTSTRTMACPRLIPAPVTSPAVRSGARSRRTARSPDWGTPGWEGKRPRGLPDDLGLAGRWWKLRDLGRVALVVGRHEVPVARGGQERQRLVWSAPGSGWRRQIGAQSACGLVVERSSAPTHEGDRAGPPSSLSRPRRPGSDEVRPCSAAMGNSPIPSCRLSRRPTVPGSCAVRLVPDLEAQARLWDCSPGNLKKGEHRS
jgi:hypothetical protein